MALDRYSYMFSLQHANHMFISLGVVSFGDGKTRGFMGQPEALRSQSVFRTTGSDRLHEHRGGGGGGANRAHFYNRGQNTTHLGENFGDGVREIEGQVIQTMHRVSPHRLNRNWRARQRPQSSLDRGMHAKLLGANVRVRVECGSRRWITQLLHELGDDVLRVSAAHDEIRSSVSQAGLNVGNAFQEEAAARR